MELVVDANIVFSAIIKEDVSYNLLFKSQLNLFTSEYIFTEIERHKEEILRKSQKGEEDLHKFLEILKKKITIIPLEELTSFLAEAEKICPDPDDVAYFSLALKLKCPIWSNDKRLKNQNI